MEVARHTLPEGNARAVRRSRMGKLLATVALTLQTPGPLRPYAV
jgi:hypothetical protein